MAAGHEVHIITGRSLKTPEFLEKIKSTGVKYTHIFSVTDHLIEQGNPVRWSDEYNPWFEEGLWNKVKGKYCEDNKIGLMIDDSPEYLEHFTTPVALMISKTNFPIK